MHATELESNNQRDHTVEVVAILQALADNVTVPDPVIWADVIALLVPYRQQQYISVVTAPLQSQIQLTQSTVQQQMQQGIDAIVVVGL
jgi:hypothetical protein